MTSTPPTTEIWSYQATRDRPLDDLPVLPTTVVRLLALERESPSYFDDLATVIRSDPALVVKVLAVANSAMYRSGKQVVRIRDAILRLGAETTARVVLARTAVRVAVPHREVERDLWVHALRVAHLARHLAAPCDQDVTPAHDAYVCGLLHDLGRFVLMNEAPYALDAMREAAFHKPSDMLAAEKVLLGIDHAALGADAARRWGLPAPIVAVIDRHHRPTSELDPLSRMAALVHVADQLDFADAPSHRLDDATIRAVLEQSLPQWYPLSHSETRTHLRDALANAECAIGLTLPFRRGRTRAS